ncbi:hypothetical protein HDU67_004218 [Dinochytrium kinnereticum]|nr:hypothetical protein HDU67_004218 [Dinochytrium kinnereticum]
MRTQVLVATDHGTVIAIDPITSEEDIVIETRCSCITGLLLKQLYPFSKCDVIVGDAEGSVVIMTRQRTLLRKSIGTPVFCLCIREGDGDFELIVGDCEGNLSAFSNLEQTWKSQIGGVDAIDTRYQSQRSIVCMLPVRFVDKDGFDMEFILVCDRSPRILFVFEGKALFFIALPCRMNSLCSGHFLALGTTKTSQPQILMGGEDGNLYVMANFELYNYASINYEIKTVMKWTVKSSEMKGLDFVFCSGHSDEVYLYKSGMLLLTIELHDWALKLALGDLNGDGKDELVVVLADSSVHVYKISTSSKDLQSNSQSPAIITGEKQRRQKIVDAILSAAETDIDPRIFEKLEPVDHAEEEEGEIDDEEGHIQASYKNAKMHAKRKTDALAISEREELLKKNSNAIPEMTALESGAQLTDSLQQAIQMMSIELEKSVAASQLLDDSSRTLKETSTQYTTLSSITDVSRKILTKLQVQSMMDRLIIIGGLTTFLSAAGYVVWKRVWLPRLPTFSTPPSQPPVPTHIETEHTEL